VDAAKKFPGWRATRPKDADREIPQLRRPTLGRSEGQDEDGLLLSEWRAGAERIERGGGGKTRNWRTKVRPLHKPASRGMKSGGEAGTAKSGCTTKAKSGHGTSRAYKELGGGGAFDFRSRGTHRGTSRAQMSCYLTPRRKRIESGHVVSVLIG
jgi:hypothetical protein